MLVSNKKVSFHHYVILLIWIGFTGWAFFYFLNNSLVSFDSTQKLTAMSHRDLAKSFNLILEQKVQQEYEQSVLDFDKFSAGGFTSILHFTSKKCRCNGVSEVHVQDINKIAKQHAFEVFNINISEDSVIPATPSIAILDELGELVYFGPYGQGLACSKTTGYAQTILKNYIQGYSANVVIKNAKGCYCTV